VDYFNRASDGTGRVRHSDANPHIADIQADNPLIHE
jgi:hypothetical protein